MFVEYINEFWSILSRGAAGLGEGVCFLTVNDQWSEVGEGPRE